jgi:hypothetical protein
LFAVGPTPLLEGRPGVVAPPRHSGFVALAGAPGGFLRAPTKHVEQAAAMTWVIRNAKFQADDGGDSRAGPKFSAEAISRRYPTDS